MERQVLMLAYYYPPEIGPAVQRPYQFARHLPSFGWTPRVITASPGAEGEVCRDWGKYLPGDIRKLFRKTFLPDRRALWKWTAYPRALKCIHEQAPKVLFSTTPPHSLHLLALRLHRETGIPWVADFRDPWTHDSHFSQQPYPDWQRAREREVLENASVVLTITERDAEIYRELGARRVEVIPNGFDPDDFTSITPAPQDSRFHLVYGGRFSAKHSATEFFAALKVLSDDGTVSPERVVVDIYGPAGNTGWAEKHRLPAGLVEFHPAVSRERFIALMAAADALLLLASGTQQDNIITGKVFEYFALKKPILACVNEERELVEMLQQYGPARIGYNGDPESMRTALTETFRGTNWPPVNSEYLARFERRAQTERLAKIFDSLE